MTTSNRPGGNFHGGGPPKTILIVRPGILKDVRCPLRGAEKVAVGLGRPLCLGCNKRVNIDEADDGR